MTTASIATRRRVRRSSAALVIALVALFVSLSGTGYALVRIGSANIRDHSIRGRDVHASTLTGAHIVNHSLTGVDIRDGSVTTANLASGAVTSARLGAGSVTPAAIGSVPSASVQFDSGHSIPDGFYTTVSFDSADWDLGDMWAAGTPDRFTATVPGIYSVSGWGYWAGDAAGFRELGLQNNTGFGMRQQELSIGAGNMFQTVSGQFRLDAGDFVQMGAMQTTGGALNLTDAGMQATWVAPV